MDAGRFGGLGQPMHDSLRNLVRCREGGTTVGNPDAEYPGARESWIPQPSSLWLGHGGFAF
jgi:hypothetical protein